jgi:PAS domain S-box-containing protein
MSAAFLGVVVLMGLDLADDAVRAAELSRQVAENDRKWARLLEKAKLLITSLDGQGNVDYVNPFFSNVTGFSADDVVGKPLGELLPSNDRARVSAEFARALDGDGPSSSETHLVTRDGGDRAVHWSHVILSDPDGEAAGLLSIGADVTDQRQAETARDEAMRELEQLKDRLAEENLYLREEIQLDRGGMNMVGESDALAYVRHRIQDVCATGATVLIHGETGVGKELVAHAIHTCSARSDKPFIRVPCAALPPSLIESELFGHVAGAYTGATGERQGRFELADGGTLLLDEVGELPLELQGKLLRVLQESEFERVGSSTTVHVDVRVLAATNRNLAKEVEAGRFREDLYYRLNVYPITVPPLRDRKSDIPLLVDHLVRSLSQRMGRDITEIPASILRKLREYDWPGNVRELENVLERAVITSPGRELRLPEALASAPAETHAPTDSNEDFLRPLRDVEKQHIQRVLENSRGRIAGPGGAAEILGLHPNTLRSRMQKLGVPTGG